MDRVRIELVAPLRIDAMRREVRAAALVAAACAAPGWTVLVAGVGRLLVRAGKRLNAVECSRPVSIPAGFAAAACGCGE